MNKNIVIVVLLIAVAGLIYLNLAPKEVDAPTVVNTTEPTDTGTQPADPASDPTPEPAPTDYTGLSTAAAQDFAEAQDTLFRVVVADGQSLPTTRDYRPGRINAVTENDVVISYTIEGEVDPATPEPTTGNDAFIGMTMTEAEAYAEANDIMFRIGKIDDEFLALTMDYRPGRVTAEIEDGVVVSYSVE